MTLAHNEDFFNFLHAFTANRVHVQYHRFCWFLVNLVIYHWSSRTSTAFLRTPLKANKMHLFVKHEPKRTLQSFGYALIVLNCINYRKRTHSVLVEKSCISLTAMPKSPPVSRVEKNNSTMTSIDFEIERHSKNSLRMTISLYSCSEGHFDEQRQ